MTLRRNRVASVVSMQKSAFLWSKYLIFTNM